VLNERAKLFPPDASREAYLNLLLGECIEVREQRRGPCSRSLALCPGAILALTGLLQARRLADGESAEHLFADVP
jgi:hypothetical protein